MKFDDVTIGNWLVKTTVDDSGDYRWSEFSVFAYLPNKAHGYHVICEGFRNKNDADLVAMAPKILAKNKQLQEDKRELLIDNIELREKLLQYISIKEFDDMIEENKKQREGITELLEDKE